MQTHRPLLSAVLFVVMAITLYACGPVTTNGDEAENHHDSMQKASEVFATLGALTVKGRLMRDSELGHPAYDETLAGEPMGAVGQSWLDLLDYANQKFITEGRISHTAGSDQEAPPAVYASGAYLYHMHHSAGRFEEHGLYESLTHTVSPTLSELSIRLTDVQYEDGAFHGFGSGNEQERMAYGLDALHGVAYAWVRWKKPGGADDMGRLTEETLSMWMGHEPEALLNAVRALTSSLDDAWSEEAGMYVFGTDEAEWRLDELGALLRGHKGLYEMLYMFGNETDAEHAAQLFDRAARILESVLGNDELIRPWGLPATLRFSEGQAHPASDTVDIAIQWRFAHQVTGGFTLIREREGTSDYFSTRHNGLADIMGDAIDTLLMGALDYQTSNGRVVHQIDYADGSVIDATPTTEAIAAFVKGLGNSYGLSNSFGSPGSWDEDEEIARQSRVLYDTFLANGRMLMEALN